MMGCEHIFLAQLASNLTLPNWVSSNLGTVLDANDYSFQFNSVQPEMARLTAGKLRKLQ